MKISKGAIEMLCIALAFLIVMPIVKLLILIAFKLFVIPDKEVGGTYACCGIAGVIVTIMLSWAISEIWKNNIE